MAQFCSILLPLLLMAGVDLIHGQSLKRETQLLRKAKAVWEDEVQGNCYNYTYRRECRCAGVQDYMVKVLEDGYEIASITDADMNIVERYSTEFNATLTVNAIFDLIESSIIDEVNELRVTYDRTLGYPARTFIDRSAQTADEQCEDFVSNLVIVDC